MFKLKIYRLVFILVVLIAGQNAMAQPKVPDRPSPPQLVNDFAGLMTLDEQKLLERELVAYDDSSSNQIAVITLKSLGDYPIEDWALEIGRKWGVGRKAKNNGVLIIVSLEPRKINISPGYGLEGALPDITCKRIITNYIAPKFKQGLYFEGITEGVKGIRAAAKGEFVNEEGRKRQGDDVPLWVFWVILIVIILFVVFIVANRKRFAEYGTGRRRYHDSSGGTIWWGGSNWGSGGGSWGSGGDSDSGGFGGFGGGDFGGGGASGDW